MYRVAAKSLAAAAVCAALAVPAVPAAVAQAPDTGIRVNVVRFYRPDTGPTMAKAFVEVPYAIATPAGTGPARGITYKITMRVLDSAGLELVKQAWTKRVPESQMVPGAYGLEIAEFAPAPGKYRLEVIVEDSVSGRKAQAAAPFEGFAKTPDASDLLLSPRMRLAEETDTVPQPGEIRRGNTMIFPAAHLRLNPLAAEGANAFYLLEVYTGSGTEVEGTMRAAVLDSAGTPLMQTRPTPIRLAAGGGVVKGNLDLTGLPEGTYRMQVTVNAAGKTVERSAPFSMIGLEEASARATQLAATSGAAAAGGGGASQSDEAYFAQLGEAELDSLYEPLDYIANRRDLRAWDKNMTVQAKRNFLTQFWKQRDPTPATERNETRERFYDAIAFANAQYGEATKAGKPGWKTDRGRVYAKFGVPDEMLDRPREGRSPPFQVWRYHRNRGHFYIFADRTGLGNYQLVYTNDRSENSLATWSDILGETGMQQASRFLGVDLFQAAGLTSDQQL